MKLMLGHRCIRNRFVALFRLKESNSPKNVYKMVKTRPVLDLA